MKIAIHPGKSWNQSWIRMCEEKNLPHIVLDCYDPNIIKKLKENNITHLMWAFSLAYPQDFIVARSLLFSAEKQMGIKVCPNFDTNWHFDDKIAEKYLLESIEADIVPSWAFFNKERALKWLENDAEYPLVAKLRKGAGSYNVILLSNFKKAKKYTNQMFGKGISPNPSYIASDFKNRSARLLKRSGFKEIFEKIKCAPKKIRENVFTTSQFQNEKGYVYFQKFIPGNKNDLRISVINNRAWGFHRGVRKNDFRASGSGLIDYNTPIPLDVVKKSLEIAKKLNMQSVCFDYIKEDDNYLIVEISYGFVSSAIYNASGFWDNNLEFNPGNFYPEEFILNDIISDDSKK